MNVLIFLLSIPASVVVIVGLVVLMTGDWDFFDNHPERRGRHRR